MVLASPLTRHLAASEKAVGLSFDNLTTRPENALTNCQNNTIPD